MSCRQSETRGRFRWLWAVERDGDLTFHTARAQLPGGLVVERVDTYDREGVHERHVFVTGVAGTEVAVTGEQSVELHAALGELPGP